MSVVLEAQLKYRCSGFESAVIYERQSIWGIIILIVVSSMINTRRDSEMQRKEKARAGKRVLLSFSCIPHVQLRLEALTISRDIRASQGVTFGNTEVAAVNEGSCDLGSVCGEMSDNDDCQKNVEENVRREGRGTRAMKRPLWLWSAVGNAEAIEAHHIRASVNALGNSQSWIRPINTSTADPLCTQYHMAALGVAATALPLEVFEKLDCFCNFFCLFEPSISLRTRSSTLDVLKRRDLARLHSTNWPARPSDA